MAWDTISHYSPVLIAPLAIISSRRHVRKKNWAPTLLIMLLWVYVRPKATGTGWQLGTDANRTLGKEAPCSTSGVVSSSRCSAARQPLCRLHAPLTDPLQSDMLHQQPSSPG